MFIFLLMHEFSYCLVMMFVFKLIIFSLFSCPALLLVRLLNLASPFLPPDALQTAVMLYGKPSAYLSWYGIQRSCRFDFWKIII